MRFSLNKNKVIIKFTKMQLPEVGIVSVANIGNRYVRLSFNSLKPQLLEDKY